MRPQLELIHQDDPRYDEKIAHYRRISGWIKVTPSPTSHLVTVEYLPLSREELERRKDLVRTLKQRTKPLVYREVRGSVLGEALEELRNPPPPPEEPEREQEPPRPKAPVVLREEGDYSRKLDI